MSHPIIAIFRKEWRQNRTSIIGTLCLCPLIYAVPFALGMYYGDPVDPGVYLGAALYIPLIFTWVMAATVYAVEHEKNTFPFLRSLPVSPLNIAIGKIGWVLVLSALFITANFLFGAIRCFLQNDFPKQNVAEILLIFCPAIAEGFVWGIFWTTRCRNATFAALASVASAVLTLVIIFNVVPRGFGEHEILMFALPLRLIVILIVGILAVWGALRWFEFSVKDTRKVWIPRNFVFARYPQRVQPPFLALIHQHLRHASLIYPLGILSFFLLSTGCLFVVFLTFSHHDMNDHAVWMIPGSMLTAMGILIFWGNIFGHDQRNHSYRFLSRIGVHEGQVWWSRMLPAAILYIPVLLCFILYSLTEAGPWEEIILIAQIAFTVWFAVLAMGAFCSISCEKQVQGIVLTFCMWYLLLFWMVLFLIFFGSSPLWTTVPIALAFLVASRLRAGYWLRDITTWRSRLIPLLPVFGTVLAVLVVLPFVRVYSVPHVSWEQINAHLAGTPAPYADQLLQHYAEQCGFARTVFSGEILADMDSNDGLFLSYYCLYFMPWEEARRERILRLQIIAALVESGVIRDARSVSFRDFCARLNEDFAGFDNAIWGDTVFVSMRDQRWTDIALAETVAAIREWYKEHGAFPESLDELRNTAELNNLAGTPVSPAVPAVHPFTGESVQYFVNSPPPRSIRSDGVIVQFFGGDRPSAADIGVHRDDFFRFGGTYVMLGERVHLLIELPTEDVQLMGNSVYTTILCRGRLPTAGRQRAVVRTGTESRLVVLCRLSPTQPPGGRLPTFRSKSETC